MEPQYIWFYLRRAVESCPGILRSPVDYFRLLFAYTGPHVPRTRKLEARSGSVQGLRREYPRTRRDDAVAAHRYQVSAVP
jgi:hypothetical protein